MLFSPLEMPSAISKLVSLPSQCHLFHEAILAPCWTGASLRVPDLSLLALTFWG